MTEPKAHYRLTSIEGMRPKGTQRPSPESMEVLRQHLEEAGVPRPRGGRPAMTEQEYTPTTESVRLAFSTYYTSPNGTFRPEWAGIFDRWLAEHDRQVAAEALEQAADALYEKAGPQPINSDRDYDHDVWNTYRAAGNELRRQAQAIRENHNA